VTEDASRLGSRRDSRRHRDGSDQQERPWVYIPQAVGLSGDRGQLQLLSVRNSFTVPILFSKEALVFPLITHFGHPLHGTPPKHPPVALIKPSVHMPGSVVGAVTGNPQGH